MGSCVGFPLISQALNMHVLLCGGDCTWNPPPIKKKKKKSVFGVWSRKCIWSFDDRFEVLGGWLIGNGCVDGSNLCHVSLNLFSFATRPGWANCLTGEATEFNRGTGAEADGQSILVTYLIGEINIAWVMKKTYDFISVMDYLKYCNTILWSLWSPTVFCPLLKLRKGQHTVNT